MSLVMLAFKVECCCFADKKRYGGDRKKKVQYNILQRIRFKATVQNE
tara:strand:+ start:249 stop:389 length:141 start_codon:yes stop_codon:yes gene_type:complete